jgi:uncharacterized repeat protein (TIGR01451 family)
MFRKLVSNLSFSPALVGQLGFYARRLKREEASRKAGLIMTALALAVQSFSVMVPPESANASSPNDLVAGGVVSMEQYLQLYDQNARSLKDIFSAANIERSELSAVTSASYDLTGKIEYGRSPVADQTDTKNVLAFHKSTKDIDMVYGRTIEVAGEQSKPGWAGYSKSNGWFAIDQASGNLITERRLESTAALPTVHYSKTARNLTQSNDDATRTVVNGGDKIQYHLTVTNTGSAAISAPVSDRLGDVLEYAQLVDTGGGAFDREEKTLTWKTINLQPGESQTRAFLVQLSDPVPATPRSLTDGTSYDCVMTNNFGNSINLAVACPSAKVVESTVAGLPSIGAGTNIALGSIVLAITAYFYARSRQLQKEIRIIRRDLNAGTI